MLCSALMSFLLGMYQISGEFLAKKESPLFWNKKLRTYKKDKSFQKKPTSSGKIWIFLTDNITDITVVTHQNLHRSTILDEL